MSDLHPKHTNSLDSVRTKVEEMHHKKLDPEEDNVVTDEGIDTIATDVLADYIENRYRMASHARNTVIIHNNKTPNQLIADGINAYAGNSGNKLFNLSQIKCNIVQARMTDVSINSWDAPFTLDPTPIPDISEEQREKIESNIELEIAEVLLENGIVVAKFDEENPDTAQTLPDFDSIMDGDKLRPEIKEWIVEQAKKQKDIISSEVNKVASKATKACEKLMRDQLAEGGWVRTYYDFSHPFLVTGTGCIRFELVDKPILKWKGNKLERTTEVVPTFRNVPIDNCYPSADAKSASEGTYFIERAEMTRKQLVESMQLDWFKEGAVELALELAEENPKWMGGDSISMETNTSEPMATEGDELIDVLIHEGFVEGRILKEHLLAGYEEEMSKNCQCKFNVNTGELKVFDKIKEGCKDEDDLLGIEDNKFYSLECFMVTGVIIGIRILDHFATTRTYYSAKYKDSGVNFWGIGIPESIEEVERRLNNYRSELEANLDVSINPPIFYDVDMFDSIKDIFTVKLGNGDLVPYEAKQTGRDNTRKPFYQVRLDSKTAELTELFSYDLRLADDLSGVPSLLSGNSNLFGGESTFRGMKLLTQSANHIIKKAFFAIDQTIIQLAMKDLWVYNMLTSEDDSIKADAGVIARGAVGLMQKELAQAEKQENLPILITLIERAGLSPEETSKIFRALASDKMEDMGYDVTTLLPKNAVDIDVAGIQPSLQPITPEPTIGKGQTNGGLSAIPTA